MKYLQKIPFIVLLLPLVAAIIICNHIKPALLWGEQPSWMDTQGVYTTQIISTPVIKNNRVNFKVECLQLTDTMCSQTIKGILMITLPLDSPSNKLQQSDILNLYITPHNASAGNPMAFDLRQYLRSQKAVGQAFCHSKEWQYVGHKKRRDIIAVAQHCQQTVLNKYKSVIGNQQNLGILSALTIGERNYLDNQTRQQFSAAGAMHILAVSGLHVGIIYVVLLQLLTFFGIFPVLYKQKMRNALNGAIIIVCLWGYALLTGLSPSVVRASLMLTLFTIGRMIYAQPNIYNIIAASAFLTLTFDPQALYSVSFQLSYAAVLSIVYFQPKISSLLKISNRYVRYVWNLLTLSVAAQLGTLPISLWYFCQTSNYFWLTNLVVIPYATILVYAALAYLLFSFSPLGPVFSLVLNYLLSGLNLFVGWIEQLPYSTSQFSLTPSMLAVMFAAIIVLALFVGVDKYKYVYVTLFALLLTMFIGLHYQRMNMIRQTKELVVFNSKPVVVTIERGRDITLITDSIEYALRITEPMRKRLFLQIDTIVDISGAELMSFSFANKHWLVVRDDVLKSKTINSNSSNIDFMLYGTTWRASYDMLFETCHPEVISLRRMSNTSRTRLESAIQNYGLPYFNASKGAFRYNFNTNLK